MATKPHVTGHHPTASTSHASPSLAERTKDYKIMKTGTIIDSKTHKSGDVVRLTDSDFKAMQAAGIPLQAA